MRNFLRVGENCPKWWDYSCSKIQNKDRLLLPLGRYRSDVVFMIFCVLFSGFLVSPAYGQEADGLKKIKPLNIGDQVPNELWNLSLRVMNHPDGKDRITLNDYRDKKLIILDFWATWCKSCLESFPKVAQFQRDFDEEVQFLMVNALQTKDSEESIQRTLHKVGMPQMNPFINRDSLFQQYFPHHILPHYVWISGDGKYLGSTSQQEMSAANLRKAIDQGLQYVHIKSDRSDYHPGIPLLGYFNNISDSELLENTLLMGYVEGIGRGTGLSTINDRLSRLYFLNSSLSYLFRAAYKDILGTLPNNRLIFDETVSKDFVRKYFSPEDYGSQFTYEAISETLRQVDLYEQLKNSLRQYFGVAVALEKIEGPVWHVGVRGDAVRSDGGDHYQMTLGSLVYKINHRFKIPILLDNNISSKIVGISHSIDSLEYSETGIEKLLNDLGLKVEKNTEQLNFARFSSIYARNKPMGLKEDGYGK